MENFCILVSQLCSDDTSEAAVATKSRAVRHSRLIMQLLFYGIQGKDAIDDLVEEGLVLSEEVDWLRACPLNTRSLLVLGWLSKMWVDLKSSGAVSDFSLIVVGDNALMGIKGGIGGTAGMIGCPLPYAYVHVVYWTVQMLLSILAVETGTMLAIFIKRAGNGVVDDNMLFSL